jgi:hypothetical protein
MAVAVAAAQTPVAPTPQTAGERLGENVSNYNIVNNFETGYRFHEVSGNLAQYRSSINYGNGIRLLGSSLSINSRDGHGALFNQLVMTTQGLAAPTRQRCHIEKPPLSLRPELEAKRYFNPGLVTAGGGGQHLLDTAYRCGPRFLFSTINLSSFWDEREFADWAILVFDSTLYAKSPINRYFPMFVVWREYRVGNEFRVLGIRVNWMRGWEDFKDVGAT